MLQLLADQWGAHEPGGGPERTSAVWMLVSGSMKKPLPPLPGGELPMGAPVIPAPQHQGVSSSHDRWRLCCGQVATVLG